MGSSKNSEKKKQYGFRMLPSRVAYLLYIQSRWPKLYGQTQSQSDILEALIEREYLSLMETPEVKKVDVSKTTKTVVVKVDKPDQVDDNSGSYYDDDEL